MNAGFKASTAFVVLLLSPAAARGADMSRARRIEERILAPCCYSEPVSQHRSEPSLAVKREIEKMVEENQSDSEIIDVLTARYGQRVLTEPEGRSGTVLRLVPVLAVAGGFFLTALYIRRMRRHRPAATGGAPLPVSVDDIDD